MNKIKESDIRKIQKDIDDVLTEIMDTYIAIRFQNRNTRIALQYEPLQLFTINVNGYVETYNQIAERFQKIADNVDKLDEEING